MLRKEKNMSPFELLDKNIDALTKPLLSHVQKEQFKIYFKKMLETNELHNLTAILDPEKVISHHLLDSLALTSFVNVQEISSIADVGSGAGLPGIPLKIYAPHLNVILIEVNKKKITFLENIIQELNLQNITIYSEDWRTFLRKTHFDVTLFLSRASLKTDELLRMFKPSSFYKKSTLIYFASKDWVAGVEDKKYMYDRKEYSIEDKIRSLIFFKNNTAL